MTEVKHQPTQTSIPIDNLYILIFNTYRKHMSYLAVLHPSSFMAEALNSPLYLLNTFSPPNLALEI